MRALLLAAVLPLSGCVGNVWFVDSRFTEEEETGIVAAANEWTELGCPVDLVMRARVDLNETGRRAVVRASERAAENHVTDRDAGWRGVHETNIGVQRIIIVPERIHDGNSRGVAAHEFGHSFGLTHSDDLESVMHQPGLYVTGPSEIDAANAGCR